MKHLLKSLMAAILLLSISIISVEAKEASVEEKISGLYVAFFNRAPDQNGLNTWLNHAKKYESEGVAVSEAFRDLSQGFASHPVFTSTYGDLNNKAFVEAIYVNALGKAGDSEGIANWKGLLDNGMSRSDMVASFIEISLTIDLTPANLPNLSAAELAIAQLRQDLIKNKVAVAIEFVNTLGSKTNVADATNPENDSAYKASVQIISSVTENGTTMTSAISFISNIQGDFDVMNKILREWDGKTKPTSFDNQYAKYGGINIIQNLDDATIKKLVEDNPMAALKKLNIDVKEKIYIDKVLYCRDLGFTGNPSIIKSSGIETKTYMWGGRTCSETNIKKGNSSIVYYFNVPS